MTEAEPEIADIVRAAFALAADRGWRRTRLDDIAAEAGMDAAAMRRAYPCKTSVLVACARDVERRAAAAPPAFEPEDTIRDRLFELIMQRLDILAGHKDAVASMLRDLPADPVGTFLGGPAILRLMGGILERAGVSAAGPAGWLRCKGLAVIWAATLMEWVRDDSPDSARTMAALDGYLRRAEPFARMLSGAGLRRAESDDATRGGTAG